MVDLGYIGNKIKTLRQQSNMTQSEFAEILGVSFQVVSNWERGIAPPGLENLIRIATHFDVLIDELLRPCSDAYYLGVDGGGTKTEFVLISSDGHILKRIKRSGSNPNDIGFRKTKELIYGGIKECVVDYPLLKNVFMGIAGISVGSYAKELRDELKESFPRLNIMVNTDVVNIFAFDDTAGMAVISGTGSVVFVRNGESYRRIGGWGYLLDRAGSAYDIGRDAICLALHEEDTLKEPSYISRRLRECFNTPTVWKHVDQIYKHGKPYIAELASIVFEAYTAGDDNAVRIIDSNAKALAELLNIGVEKHAAEPLAIADGGLFEHYSNILVDHISRYTSVKLLVNELSPIYGACRMARCMSGEEAPSEFYENFKKSWERYEQ